MMIGKNMCLLFEYERVLQKIEAIETRSTFVQRIIINITVVVNVQY